MSSNAPFDSGQSYQYDYQTGFGNDLATEARSGALPVGQNSPQQAPLGLYAEKFSGTAFTAPKANNFRSWFYRIRPSVAALGYSPFPGPPVVTAPVTDPVTPPDPLRWDPWPLPEEPTDFVDGLITVAACGDAATQAGAGIHVYRANRSMEDRFFFNCDGELLLVPEHGAITVHTECGILQAAPGAIVVVPRGVRFRVALAQDQARGYVCENYGALFELPERGPIGSDSLANRRDFEIPVAAFEDREGDFELVCKLDGQFFAARTNHSPLNVVAWHGTLYPYRYDLFRFNTIGSISYDHPDPSIFTVLTSQSDTPGTAGLDFVIFPPRWLVMENTFRPPWYHRNVMSEFMGLVRGVYDAKPSGGFVPGGASLHNCMTPHGPDLAAYDGASQAALKPEFLADTMAFMFESRYLIKPTRAALEAPTRQADYASCWAGLNDRFER